MFLPHSPDHGAVVEPSVLFHRSPSAGPLNFAVSVY